MRFRSIDCDGADERARWFDAPNGNARRSDVAFDGTHANAPRSHDEFTIGLPTLWHRRLRLSMVVGLGLGSFVGLGLGLSVRLLRRLQLRRLRFRLWIQR